MNIGIISDTHNNLSSINKAFDIFKQEKISLILHCGDWTTQETINHISLITQTLKSKVYGVFGNRDLFWKSYIPQKNIVIEKDIFEFEIDSRKITLYHGHKKNILKELIESQKFDVVCTGHSHKPSIVQVGKTKVINPGSTAFAIPRKKDFKGTIFVLDTLSLEPRLMEI